MSIIDDVLAVEGVVDARLAKQVRDTAAQISREEASGLVDLYYTLQEHRIALGNQSSAAGREQRPHLIPDYFGTQFATLERQMRSVLNVFAHSQDVGLWSLDQLGIGPVLAAGLLAHIDITQAPTVGHIWSFAGLNPEAKWNKGEKRPWNARLKVLCWKIGDSFVKVSGRDNALYGKLYRSRKEYEVARNEAGGNAAAAAETLRIRKIVDKPTRAIYESGKLPPGRLDLRARRYATKIFLAHWHHVAYLDHYKTLPPKPYVLEHVPGHVHKIVCPSGGNFTGEAS